MQSFYSKVGQNLKLQMIPTTIVVDGLNIAKQGATHPN
jgi:hypothetical protein